MITAKEQIGVMLGWLWIRGINERHCTCGSVYTWACVWVCECVFSQSTGMQPFQQLGVGMLIPQQWAVPQGKIISYSDLGSTIGILFHSSDKEMRLPVLLCVTTPYCVYAFVCTFFCLSFTCFVLHRISSKAPFFSKHRNCYTNPHFSAPCLQHCHLVSH